MSTFSSLQQFIDSVSERFNVPRRSATSEGIDKQALLQSLLDVGIFVSETNSETFIQNSILEAAQHAVAAGDTQAATQLIYDAVLATKNQAETLVNNAVLASNPLGEWNANTNLPALTVTPTAGVVGSYYDVWVAGAAPFAGDNFAAGFVFPIGSKLIKKSSTTWRYQPPSDLALTKAQALEAKLPIVNMFNPAAAIDGYQLDISGNPTVNSSYGYSDYIAVNTGEVWSTGDGTTPALNVNFYNASYTHLGNRLNSSQSTTFTIPANARYMRVVYYATRKLTTQVEKSSAPTPYTPYGYSDGKNLILDSSLVRTDATRRFTNDADVLEAKFPIWSGGAIETAWKNIVVDIQIFGYKDPEPLFIYEITRNYTGSGNKWRIVVAKKTESSYTIVSIFQNNSYTEPVADAQGRIIGVVDLAQQSGSGVTGKAIVDWSKIADGVQIYNVGANYVKSLLNPKVYNPTLSKENSSSIAGILTSIASLGTANTTQDNRLTTNETDITNLKGKQIWLGSDITTFWRNSILDLQIYGYNDVEPLYVLEIARNYTGSGNKWRVVIGKKTASSYVIVALFQNNSYTEPVADVQGRMLGVLDIAQQSGSGVTGRVLVDWSKVTDGTITQNNGANYVRGLISPSVYNTSIQRYINDNILSGGGATPTALETNLPGKVYSLFSNITGYPKKGTNLYLDNIIKLNSSALTNIRFSNGSDKLPVIPKSPTSGNTGSEILNIVTKKGDYAALAATINHQYTKASILSDKNVLFMPIGDSQTVGSNANYSGSGNLDVYWMQILSEVKKMAIAAGSGYNIKSLGHILKYTRSFNFNGVTQSVTGCANGLSGTSLVSWLKHTGFEQQLRDGGQAVWDLMGLGNGTGTDWTGSNAQRASYIAVCEGQNSPTLTGALYAWLGLGTASAIGNGITTTEQNAITTACANRLNNPVNKYFDKDKTGATRFSLAKYLTRRRTLLDDGVTRAAVGTTAGTEVTDVTAYDVCTPSHIIFRFSENEWNIFQPGNAGIVGAVFQQAIDAVHEEYPNILVGVAPIGDISTFFPELYPNVSVPARVVSSWKYNFIKNIRETVVETSKSAVIPIYLTQPTAFGWAMERIQNEISDNPFQEMSESVNWQTLNGDAYHPGGYAHASWAYQMLSWIAYTYS